MKQRLQAVFTFVSFRDRDRNETDFDRKKPMCVAHMATHRLAHCIALVAMVPMAPGATPEAHHCHFDNVDRMALET